MKRGLILINAYAQSVSELNGAKRLKEELEMLGVSVEIKRNVLSAGIIGGKAESFTGNADFCIYLDKDRYAGELLQNAGLRLFNSPQAIADCDDKMRTYLALAGFPLPDTISAPLCYTPQEPVSAPLLDGVEEHFGYPVIVKESYGSLGKEVYKADNREELQILAERLKCKPHLFQKFIATSAGRDVRVIVIGGKVFAAMLRTAKNDFRSNIELGGTGEVFALNEAGIKLCEDVSKRLNLDYCGIDLLFGENGFLVCEVNSNAFFGGIERVTGKNVARAYAKYIIKEIYGVSAEI